MTKIKFPLVEGYWDGMDHDIEPKTLERINDTEYYYMKAFDNSYGFLMATILKENNNKFYKVPLSNYETLNDILSKCNMEALDPKTVGEYIGLLPIMNPEELEESIGLNARKR